MQGKKHLEHYFSLLRDILSDSFHIDAHLLEYPYHNLEKIDNGLRGIIWKNMDYHYDSKLVSHQIDQHMLTLIKSNLGFYNLLCVIAHTPHPSYISIGPFRDSKTTPKYYEDIIQKTRLPQTDILSMQQLYRKIPMIDIPKIINLTKRILAEVNPDYAKEKEYVITFSESNNSYQPNTDFIKRYSISYSEHIRSYFCDLYTEMKKGNIELSRSNLHLLLEELNVDQIKDPITLKYIVQNINIVCLMALFRTSVHPSHALNLYNRFIILIDSTLDIRKLAYLPYDICHKYYLLVHNYNHPEYTKLTRDVIAYIRSHLEEELSLAVIAHHYQKNPSSLSGTFSKDTGYSLTEYIHKERIEKAVRLLNTTNLPIFEISLAVGFKDFAYFSRVFRKQIGTSPRQYRNMRK